MTRAQAMKWVDALRSGKYKQTTETLQDANGFCCLGVACEIFIPESRLQHYSQTGYLIGRVPGHQMHCPRWLRVLMDDFHEISGIGLSELNDDYYFSFNEIADVIQLIYCEGALK